MKYFSTDEPYSATIAAESHEEAIKLYIETVADDDDGMLNENMEEISRDEALINLARSKDMETGKYMPINDILNVIETSDVLTMEMP